jgi:antitoxin ParD1/3/4
MAILDKDGQFAHDGSMNVALTPELEELIRRKLASGMYKNAAEVVREGLRLLAEEDAWKAEVRRRISTGMAQLRSGQVEDGETAVNEVVKSLRRRRAKTKRK